MKLLFILSAFVVLTLAQGHRPIDFDLSKFKEATEKSENKSEAQKVNRNGRIIGGQYACEGQFPHQVMLLMDGIGMCGGSLIKPFYVLTVRSFIIKS